MQNNPSTKISRATESLTLYIVHTYLSPDEIYHDIFQDYYWRAFGINLDLCPRDVIKHCEWLKENPNCLFYHYFDKTATEQENIDVLDVIIKELKEKEGK